jgi:rod shape determining protein RodA
MKRNDIARNTDYGVILIYLILVLMGLTNIYSSTFDESYPNLFSFNKEYGKQIIWILVSLIAGFSILNIEGRFISRATPFFYVFVVFLLIAVLFTTPINGARSWFNIGGFSFQPSEFAKLGTALMLSKYLNNTSIKIRDVRTRFQVGLLIGIPSVLILLQPDAGTLLVFFSFFLVLYREGLSGNVLLIGLLSGILMILSIFLQEANFEINSIDLLISGQMILTLLVLFIGVIIFYLIRLFTFKRDQKKSTSYLIAVIVGAVILINATGYIFNNVFKQRHRDRINLLLGLMEDKKDAGYNIYRAMAAVGSGGFSGKGYRSGVLANERFKHVPEQGTDFIFCSIGEEWGFIGSSLVIIMFMMFLIKIVSIAERQRNTFSRVYAYCVAGIFFFHLTINVGMIIGLAPVIGIPLPFFSYGGSSLLNFSVLFFILVRLDAERMDSLQL